jgi:hypothetical protein
LEWFEGVSSQGGEVLNREWGGYEGFKLAINYSEDRFELGVGRRCKFKADLRTESRWSDEGPVHGKI